MEDCCVEYRVYIQNKGQQDLGEHEDKYRSLLAEYVAYLSSFIGDYIWQNEPFRLAYTTKHGDGAAHLCGRTNYGNNVEDEWFIVYLLFQLTLKYQDICVSVQDSDGDFLLIEAAHELPKWLNPETSENRVFIQGGKLHIITLPSTPREITTFPTGTPSLSTAMELIHGPYETIAGTKIQQTVNKRFEGYPERAKGYYHHVNCFVPPTVKYILDQNPSLISAAVQAFCHRDPIDTKALREARNFPPTERVMTRVRFTRCLYAQVTQQDFQPDRKSGWATISSTSPQYKAHHLGMKVTCGFEILCSKIKSNTSNKALDKCCGAEWESFLGFLKKQGFFKGEIEGSNLYTKLLLQAENHFLETFSSERSSSNDPGSVVLSMLQNADIDINKMKKQQDNLLPEDDDSWLDISPGDLDALLNQYRTANRPAADTNQENKFDLQSVTKTMTSFVDKLSSHEGAEFPGEDETEEIDFDADSFVETMKQLLGGRPQAEELSSDDDEYLSDVSDSDEGNGEEQVEFASYMEEMDRQLANTKIGKSFEKEEKCDKRCSAQSEARHESTPENGIEDMASEGEHIPVDVDLNLVKNMLESFSSQQGLAGPATNILNAMGVRLPLDEAIKQTYS